MQAVGTVGVSENHPPTSGNVSKGRPNTVLFFVINQDEKTSIFVVERIDLQRMDPLTSRH